MCKYQYPTTLGGSFKYDNLFSNIPISILGHTVKINLKNIGLNIFSNFYCQICESQETLYINLIKIRTFTLSCFVMRHNKTRECKGSNYN